ncbi:hypothetical protein JAAARDRAFT_187282 [Jaapia argillacea MUCL 33604]|uniref:Autophagy-related protein 16 domain-containing protein n=1 Tax=Jaapia argillacea MUCL 33604 TaxID=933084 RepID=A0A067QMM2_9AGAM|nr:hypothetical protein JAAARDRAFT_187282 [Jaapia argillacea MUCL 33604]
MSYNGTRPPGVLCFPNAKQSTGNVSSACDLGTLLLPPSDPPTTCSPICQSEILAEPMPSGGFDRDPVEEGDFLKACSTSAIMTLSGENSLLWAMVASLQMEKASLELENERLKIDEGLTRVWLGTLNGDVVRLNERLLRFEGLEDEFQRVQLSLEASKKDTRLAKDQAIALESDMDEQSSKELGLWRRLEEMTRLNNLLLRELAKMDREISTRWIGGLEKDWPL